MINSNSPGGIDPKSVEIFTHKDDLLALYQEQIISVWDLPKNILRIYHAEIWEDKKALETIEETFQLSDDKDILQKYISCNYGGFDLVPDYQEGDTNKEIWECGQRGNCPAEGIVCPPIETKEGSLTRQELEIIKWITTGLPDKIIACKLNISCNTVTTHTANIRRKIGANNRIEIMLFAIKNNLIKQRYYGQEKK